MSRITDEVTRARVEVMKAYLMKKDIEVTLHDDQVTGKPTVWYDVISEPEWDWGMATWRIKPDGVTVKELIEGLNRYDGGLRVILNFEDQNFDIGDLCQDGEIVDIFTGKVVR